MNRIFGTKKPQAPKPTLTDAINNTDARVDSIEVKMKKYDAELARYREQMAKMPEGPSKNAIKQRALQVLKQKKMYEGQRNQLQQQVFNMDQAHFATESLQNTVTTVEAMKTAAKAMKQEFKKIDINKVENMQDELEDLLADAGEVQEVLARTYGLPDDVDEADLEAELDALAESGAFEAELEGPPSYLEDSLPTAPSTVEAPKAEETESASKVTA